MIDFEFIQAPFLYGQNHDIDYCDLARARRLTAGGRTFDQVLVEYSYLKDCESIFFDYTNFSFELRCHVGLRDAAHKSFFLLPFGSMCGIGFRDGIHISESVLKDACRMLIIEPVHGS
jgi:hypothetical protein